ncbi:unnamed protein product [Rodentolepis nana]|uniref:Clathrin light chain n=1 Tax=Rodentolepis nana TaxID=102285 RepID=A0A0R3TZ17_RODNA|nr:unnamed protein product [Rodentolepis nana]
MHHRIFSRIWAMLKPYIDKLEAEFDKGQLESIAEREAGEKELWAPIASAPFFKKSPGADPLETPKSRIDSFDPDDLDSSEAQFVQSFIPHRLQMSTEKNKLALDTMTREIMSTCRNQDDIDYWFAEVTEDPRNVKRGHTDSGTENNTTPSDQVVLSNANSLDPTFNSDFDSAAWDEFSQSSSRRSCCNIVYKVAFRTVHSNKGVDSSSRGIVKLPRPLTAPPILSCRRYRHQNNNKQPSSQIAPISPLHRCQLFTITDVIHRHCHPPLTNQ